MSDTEDLEPEDDRHPSRTEPPPDEGSAEPGEPVVPPEESVDAEQHPDEH